LFESYLDLYLQSNSGLHGHKKFAINVAQKLRFTHENIRCSIKMGRDCVSWRKLTYYSLGLADILLPVLTGPSVQDSHYTRNREMWIVIIRETGRCGNWNYQL